MGVKHPEKKTQCLRFFGVSASVLLFEVLAVGWIYRHGGILTPAQTTWVMLIGSAVTSALLYSLVMRSEFDGVGTSRDRRTIRDPRADRDIEKDQLIDDMKEAWGLSEAETAVTVFAVKGFSNREISEFRGSSIATVKKQLSSVYRKSGLENRFQLIAHINDEAMALDLRDTLGEGAAG